MRPIRNESFTINGGQEKGLHLPAPIWKRTLAYSADLIIVTCLLYGVIIIVGLSGALNPEIYSALIQGTTIDEQTILKTLWTLLILLIAILVLYHGYFIYFELKKGWTPGKKIFGLQVISLKGAQLTARQCILRDMMRYVDVGLVVPGLLSMLLTKRSQRLGDLAAGTLVIQLKPRTDSSERPLAKPPEDFLK